MAFIFDIEDLHKLDQLKDQIGDDMVHVRKSLQNYIDAHEELAAEWDGDDETGEEEALLQRDKAELLTLLLKFLS